MISVIITVHPALIQHLFRARASVRWQLADEDELIVVGDKCDGLLPKDCADILHVTKGVSAARNAGLAAAKNPWIKFLDADDLLAPFALNWFRTRTDKLPPEYAVLAGSLMQVRNGLYMGAMEAADIEKVITTVNPCLVSMAFVRREAALAVQGFDERIEFEEDWDFWLRLRRAGHRFARTQMPFCYYCIDDAERAAKVRSHEVDGMPVRQYLAATYGITPKES